MWLGCLRIRRFFTQELVHIYATRYSTLVRVQLALVHTLRDARVYSHYVGTLRVPTQWENTRYAALSVCTLAFLYAKLVQNTRCAYPKEIFIGSSLPISVEPITHKVPYRQFTADKRRAHNPRNQHISYVLENKRAAGVMCPAAQALMCKNDT